MKRRFPFAVKLGLSFVIVILIAVALVYFLTARSINARFSEFRTQNREQIARQVSGLLAAYRMETGSWFGIERLLSTQYTVFINGRLIVRRTSMIGPFSLADENGRVIVSTKQNRVGTMLTPKEIASGIPISIGSTRVGTLVLDSNSSILDPAEEKFLTSAKHSALIGGGIATGVAMFLSMILISQVLSPLRLLSRATERIARGDLTQRVVLRARDEFGQLGESFNRMIDNLRRSERVRQTMTADIAHELRTPVTIIQGNLEAILDGIYEPTPETIAPIYEETLHLGRLIDDLRELSLAEAGELPLNREPTDLLTLVEQVTETIIGALDDGPKIVVKAEDNLPSIVVDPMRIRQVIVNLVSNAVRYTPKEGKIEVTLREVDEEIELAVADNGPGISPDDLPHLFERFYRGDRARTRASGGSGLGLAIAKQWVEAHGGRIWAENLPEGGARFTVRLPIS